MKAVRIALIIILSALVLVSCAEKKGTSGSLTVVTDEKGNNEYLILPKTNERVYIYHDDARNCLFAYNVTDEMIAKAEAEILNMIPKSYDIETEGIGFQLSHSNGILYLVSEIIVDIDPPRVEYITGENGEEEAAVYSGCGIDHEHRFFEAVVAMQTENDVGNE